MERRKLDDKLEQAVTQLEQAQTSFDVGNFENAATALNQAHSLCDEVLTELEDDEDLSSILDQMENLGSTEDWQSQDADELKTTSAEIAEIKTNLEAYDLPEAEVEEGN